MTTSVQIPVEPNADQHLAEEAPSEKSEQVTPTRRRGRAAFVFVFGFLLGAALSTATSLGGRRMPLVLGNRNLFISLPFSGVSLSAPSVATKGRRAAPLARLNGLSRRKEHVR